jgi:hypothetical protein
MAIEGGDRGYIQGDTGGFAEFLFTAGSAVPPRFHRGSTAGSADEAFVGVGVEEVVGGAKDLELREGLLDEGEDVQVYGEVRIGNEIGVSEEDAGPNGGEAVCDGEADGVVGAGGVSDLVEEDGVARTVDGPPQGLERVGIRSATDEGRREVVEEDGAVGFWEGGHGDGVVCDVDDDEDVDDAGVLLPHESDSGQVELEGLWDLLCVFGRCDEPELGLGEDAVVVRQPERGVLEVPVKAYGRLDPLGGVLEVDRPTVKAVLEACALEGDADVLDERGEDADAFGADVEEHVPCVGRCRGGGGVRRRSCWPFAAQRMVM